MVDKTIGIRLAFDTTDVPRGTDRAIKSFRSLGSELTRFRSIATGALSFAGIGLGVSELVRAADQYGQITARLQLATRATGDFEQVQDGLRRAAEQTRAPLQDTVNLYSQIAPSLRGILSSQEIVGVVTTVNQAIAMSGSSAAASSAALVQFTQGLASGTLRGEELNSILEQTPALADAIAEGLSVTRGQLRQLGSDGELTTERLVRALQKVSGRVASDFQSVPLTVGQSLTLLQNAFTELVGTFDQGTGATSALARGIVAVSAGLSNFGAASESLRPVVEFVVDSVDGVARVFRIIGTGLAGYTVAIKQALSGDLKGALETYKDIGRQVEAILLEPTAAQQNATSAARKGAVDRLQVEAQLAEQIARLEKLRAVAAGSASADVLKSDKTLAEQRNKIAQDSLKERLKGEETLADALRKASEQSLKDAEKVRREAADMRTKGRDTSAGLQDKAAERRNRNLSEHERSDIAERDVGTLTARATLRAGEALAASREGDLQKAARLAEEASKLAQRAEAAADAIANDDTAANVLEELGRVQEKIANAQVATKEQEAVQLEAQTAAQNEQLAQSEARIEAITSELAKPITLQLDISEAEKQIAQLKQQLSGLGNAGVPAATATGASISSFAYGGYTGPGTKYQPAGVVHAGEYVLRREVVRQAGMVEFLNSLNRQGLNALRGYAGGGVVQGISVGEMKAPVNTMSSGDQRPIVLDFGSLGRVNASSTNDEVQKVLSIVLRRAALKSRRG